MSNMTKCFETEVVWVCVVWGTIVSLHLRPEMEMACGRGNCRSECLILASKNPLLSKTYQKIFQAVGIKEWVFRFAYLFLCCEWEEIFLQNHTVWVMIIPLPYRLQRVEAVLVTLCRAGWFGGMKKSYNKGCTKWMNCGHLVNQLRER